jgi:hypothetical protein
VPTKLDTFDSDTMLEDPPLPIRLQNSGDIEGKMVSYAMLQHSPYCVLVATARSNHMRT